MQLPAPLFEICANGLQSAINAQLAGADRIELCEHLHVGGITPSITLLKKVCEAVQLPVHVLIRPHAAGFNYSPASFDLMKEQIAAFKALQVKGLVFGILRNDLAVDTERCAELIGLCRPLTVTFHRAFDEVQEPFAALQALIELGVDRVLTSGQEENVLEGSPLIRQLVEMAAGRITIMAGGGITAENIASVVEISGTNEFHFSAKLKTEGGYFVSDRDEIRKICAEARNTFNRMHRFTR